MFLTWELPVCVGYIKGYINAISHEFKVFNDYTWCITAYTHTIHLPTWHKQTPPCSNCAYNVF